MRKSTVTVMLLERSKVQLINAIIICVFSDHILKQMVQYIDCWLYFCNYKCTLITR